jgi:uncharacterized membrane protein YidH (DUF202 family)
LNIIALIVAIVAFFCALWAAFAPSIKTEPPRPRWGGWLALAIALFIAAVILQLVFAPHGLIQYQPAA